MNQPHKSIMPLVIAGFDPSTGAGLTRDLLVFEEHKLAAVSVCTAITYQNERQFFWVDWLPENKILQQIEVLSQQYIFEYVKIGLVKNVEVLAAIVHFLLQLNSATKIIWDPVLRASAGFVFHKNIQIDTLSFLNKLYLITPNIEEAGQLGIILNNNLPIKTVCAILIKSFRSDEKFIVDLLLQKNERTEIGIQKIKNGTIHGSGCRLSSAIVANLVKGSLLEQACKLAQKYLAKKIKKHGQ